MASKKFDEKSYTEKELINTIKEKITELEIFKETELVILFGSRAKKEHTSESDLDLAFLLKTDFYEQINLLELRINLSNHFSELTEIETDIVILNCAKPLLKFQVLKYGKPLYINNEFSYEAYFSKSLREYFDFKYYKKYHYQKMRERLS